MLGELNERNPFCAGFVIVGVFVWKNAVYIASVLMVESRNQNK